MRKSTKVCNKKVIFEHQMEIKANVQRDQISFSSIEDSIEKDNPIRVIEAFIEHINLKELGFEIEGL